MKIHLQDLDEHFSQSLQVHILDKNGKPLAYHLHEGKTYVVGKKDNNFSVQIQNPNPPLRTSIFLQAFVGTNPFYKKDVESLCLLTEDQDGDLCFEEKDPREIRITVGDFKTHRLKSCVIYYKSEEELIKEGIMKATHPIISPKEAIKALEKSQARKNKNIYVLAVAINDYPLPHHQLNGCINDARAVVEHITAFYESTDTAVHLKSLLDEEATHQNISQAFLEHLGQAQADDSVLFYFCGHGSQEPCPKEFLWEEPTKMNSGIVCHDSRNPELQNTYDLADKELRYLIWQVEQKTKAKVLVIMDCCHSGGGTRDIDNKPELSIRTRKIDPSSKVRPLESFNFYPEIQKNPHWIQPQGICLPHGKHLQMAASHSTQTAKETICEGRQHGVFTHFLLETLRESKGNISYEQLRDCIIGKVGKKVNDQSPEIAVLVPNDDQQAVEQLLKSKFLSTQILPKEQIFEVVYNQEFSSWEIAAGTVHGLPQGASNSIIAVYENRAALNENLVLAKANVAEAYVQVAELAFEQEQIMEKYKNQTLLGKIWHIDKPKVPIYFDQDANNPDANAAFQENFEKISQSKALFFCLVDKAQDAQYRLVVENDKYAIKKVGQTKPLVKPQKQADAAIAMLDQVAQWLNQLDISNPNTLLPADALKVEANVCYFNQSKTRNGTLTQMLVKKQDQLLDIRNPIKAHEDENFKNAFQSISHSSLIKLDYSNNQDKWTTWKRPEMSFRITNNYDMPLYITFLQFNQRFGIKFCSKKDEIKVQGDTKQKEAYLLAPKQSLDFEMIAYEVEDIFWQHGLLEREFFGKIIYSTFPIKPQDYLLDELPLPEEDDMARSTRALGTVIEPNPDFAVFDLRICVFRPAQALNLQGESQLNGIGVSSQNPLTLAMLSEKLARESIAQVSQQSLPDDMLKTQGASNFSLTEDNDLSVLQILNPPNPQELNQELAQNPLRLDFTGKIEANEAIITLVPTHDGLVLPMIAQQNPDGSVSMEISQVPTQISPAGSRSLGGSLKMMMQKMITEAIGAKFNAHPILALVKVAPDGSKMEYLGKNQRDCMEKVQEKLNNQDQQNCIIFIHGITGDTKDMPQSLFIAQNFDQAYAQLSQRYDVILTFDYENLNTTIEQNAQHLKDQLQEAGFFRIENGKIIKNPSKNLHIVAHSMGGLVSRWFIEQLQGDQVVDHLIMCGTPNGGSPWARIKDMVIMALTLVLSKVSLAAWAVAPLTFLFKKVADEGIVSLKQMNPQSDFYKKLNDENLKNPKIPYTILAGNTSKIDEQNLTATMEKAAQKLNIVLENWLFTQAHDIAVSVEYIKVKKVWEKMGRNVVEFPVHAQLPQDISTDAQDIVILETACDHMSYFTNSAGVKALAEVLLKRVN